jgi:hypothetical protein
MVNRYIIIIIKFEHAECTQAGWDHGFTVTKNNKQTFQLEFEL